MANINVSAQKLVRGTAGLAPSLTTMSVTDTYLVENDGTVFLFFVGDAASARTATIVTPTTVDGNAVTDVALNIPINGRIFWGLMPPDLYNSAGRVSVTISGTTVQFAAIRV